MDKYGSYLRDLRQKNGDTLEDLAKKMNTHFSTLAKWERGERKITGELMERIAAIYNINPAYFFNGEIKQMTDNEVDLSWKAFIIAMEDKGLTAEQVKSVMDYVDKIKDIY